MKRASKLRRMWSAVWGGCSLQRMVRTPVSKAFGLENKPSSFQPDGLPSPGLCQRKSSNEGQENTLSSPQSNQERIDYWQSLSRFALARPTVQKLPHQSSPFRASVAASGIQGSPVVIEILLRSFCQCDVVRSPNDPSSATAPAAAVERTVRSRIPATLERTAQRPFAAALWLGCSVNPSTMLRNQVKSPA